MSSRKQKKKPNNVFKKQITPEEKKQLNIDIANKIKSSTITTINTADLIKILQPAIRVELRKSLFPGLQQNSKNDPMHEVNKANLEPILEEISASATTQCKINNITFTNAGVDSGASNSIMSSKVLSQLDLNINNKNGSEGKLSGIATSVKTLGWINNVPVSFKGFTIYDNFLVVEDSNPILILGNNWLK